MSEIISASRRTDIPAFFGHWFAERLSSGHVLVRNPFCLSRTYQVSLAPADVAGFVFWTRHPAPFIDVLETLERMGFAFYFQVTLNAYPEALEPHLPPLETSLAGIRELARRFGKERVLWRYDPIVLTSALTPRWHLENFGRLATALQGCTAVCTTSFVQLYKKTRRGLDQASKAGAGEWIEPSREAKIELAQALIERAAGHGLELHSCCDEALLAAGARQAKCVDAAGLLALGGRKDISAPPQPSRPGCGCDRSRDIGAYDTCAFGCRYCYALAERGGAER